MNWFMLMGCFLMVGAALYEAKRGNMALMMLYFCYAAANVALMFEGMK